MKKDGVEQIIGIKTRAQVIKNRMGPPLKSIDYDIYFESGIDDFGGWLNVMKDYKLVSQSGAWYTYKKLDGTEIKFQSKDFEKRIEDDQALKSEIYQAICEAYILTYQPGENIGIDDIEIDSDFVNEEE
jgi:recombination protein RecA